MNELLVVALVVAGTGVTLLLMQLATLRGSGEPPVGPRTIKPVVEGAPPLVPAGFQQLVSGEARHWKLGDDWQRLLAELDSLALEFGVEGPGAEPPKSYDEAWLDARLGEIEVAAGVDRPNPLSLAEQKGTAS